MKDNKCDGTCADNECICDDLPEGFIQTYSIEQIETAVKEEINNYFGITMRESVTKVIISNLKNSK